MFYSGMAAELSVSSRALGAVQSTANHRGLGNALDALRLILSMILGTYIYITSRGGTILILHLTIIA